MVIHQSPVDSPHKGQWRGALLLSLISAWTNGRANYKRDGDLRRHRAHYAATVMMIDDGQAKPATRAPSQYPKRRLSVRSRNVSKRFVFRIVRSLWNLTGTSAAVLPMCLSNFKAIRQFKVPISSLRDFTRSYEKTSFRIFRRGPGSHEEWLLNVCVWVYSAEGRWYYDYFQ